MKILLCMLLLSSVVSAQSSDKSVTTKVLDAVQPLNPWQNQFCFTIDGAFPLGSAANTIGSGIGFNATYYYHAFSHNQFLSFGLGYFSMAYSAIADYHYTIVPIQVGYRYNFEIRSVQPYVGAELGGAYTTSAILSDTVRTSTQYKTETTFPFIATAKTGVRVPIDKNVDMDAHVKYNMSFSSPDAVQFISAGIGVSFRFDSKQ